MSPTRSVNFDRIADRYDETRGGLGRGRVVADAFAPYLVGGRVLEIGVGTGVVAAPLRADGFAVVGVDLSSAMLASARARLGPVVARADAQKLPVAAAAVDVVVAAWVLHVVADLDAVLAEVARVLRPGGRFLVVRAGAAATHDPDEIEAALAGFEERLRPRQDTEAALVAHGRRHGLIRRAAAVVTGERRDVTPEQTAQMLEQRVWSSLWDVPDEVWQRDVVPAIARVRALPDPHRPRTCVGRLPLYVAERE